MAGGTVGRMGLSTRCHRDQLTGLWTATGEDGERPAVTVTAGTADEAAALVREAFGLAAYRPRRRCHPGGSAST